MSRPVIVMETAFTRESVMITTKQGEAFHGTIVPKKLKATKTPPPTKDIDKLLAAKSEFNKFINKDDCMVIKLKRLPNIHRAVDICGDVKGNNFAVLQVSPNSGLLDLPQITSSQLRSDFSRLLEDASEFDKLHDVILKVDNQTIPAHKYIISNGCEYFAKLCSLESEIDNIHSDNFTNKSGKLIIKVENVHLEIMKQILQFLYTGSCDVLNKGPCKIRIKREPIVINGENEIITNENVGEIIITNLDNVSAFEVYKKDKAKKINSKKSKQNKSKMENIEDDSNNYYDPVRLLQEAAKKLQVTSLYKILARYYYRNGNVLIKEDEKKPKVPKFGFHRTNMNELWDTTIKCLDQHYIQAHRCILAARLDYFNGMFAHSWTESSENATISLPIHSSILIPIINFLYSDECPELAKSEELEFLCNMLVIADQLFITRLREMCEVTFSSLLTLKNVPEIFQLASTCNCPQLKKCCMEYISLNLPTLLESKALETMSDELLEELSSFYSVFNPAMCSRVITPFSEAPCDEEIISIANSFPVNLDDTYEEEAFDEIKKDFPLSNSAKKKNKVRNTSFSESEKARKRNESVSSVTSLDLSYEKSDDVMLSLSKISSTEDVTKSKGSGWVKVKKPQKIVEARLKVINAAKENSSILESYPESFTKLVKQDNFYDRSLSASSPPVQSPISRHNSFGSPRPSSSPISQWDVDPYYDPNQELLSRSPQTTLNVTVVNTKLSQKQRKKLALEGKDQNSLAEQLDKLNMKKSLWEHSPDSPPDVVEIPVRKNPWQIIEQPAEASIPKSVKVNFSDIVEDEIKKKENFSKMMAKPLILTQLEDQAIEELTKFYSATSVVDEKITVKRVQCYQFAAPRWINRSILTLN